MTERVSLADMYVDEQMRSEVLETLNSGRWIKGPKVEEFGERFASRHGASHGVPVSNGTSALYLAYKAVGFGSGDEVLVPSHTFAATVHPLLELGCKPVFCDVDPETCTIDPEEAQRKVGSQTEGLVAVHLYGHPADMDPLTDLANDHNLAVVEDAAQAHGATYKGNPVGSLGDAAAWSFYPTKNMTVGGDGGMVTTDDDDVAETVEALANHGRRPGSKHEHDLVSLNFRMSELQGAVGQVQLDHLDEWTQARQNHARYLRKGLAHLDALGLPSEAAWATHVYHQFAVRTSRREELQSYLDDRGVDTGIHYPVPCHRQPGISKAITSSPDLPTTDTLADQVLSLPVHPFLTEDELQRVVDTVSDFFQEASP